ncbi:hypothetical protein CC117_22430 [Parafrankia colletiae]|uniref:HTH tetR-type domain-containing protein n=1 Tax=Parafrankia colletiae TaxID=573497 RepID=A0A1S1QH01_9ACTN|nr:hypothetical protein CC117_22430 [Parafrankia colletiae]
MAGPAAVAERAGGGRTRRSGADRREALLDAAATLIVAAGADAVSMDAVADSAGVSRALLYKHFANRGTLLAAVYRREAVLLHAELATEVRAAETVEGMYRALLRGALRASLERRAVFLALRAAGAVSLDLDRERDERDEATVRAFAARTTAEYGIGEDQATAASSMLLAAINPILHRWNRAPTEQTAALIEETFLMVVRGALAVLSSSTEARTA